MLHSALDDDHAEARSEDQDGPGVLRCRICRVPRRKCVVTWCQRDVCIDCLDRHIARCRVCLRRQL